jgi:predicted nuclease with RNAse H fold
MSKTSNSINVHSDFTEQIKTTACRNIASSSRNERSEHIEEMARKATSCAANDALRNGRAITIQQGNDIVRKFPDGRVEVIKTLENAFIVPKRRMYKL